jgi:hypothetical protein
MSYDRGIPQTVDMSFDRHPRSSTERSLKMLELMTRDMVEIGGESALFAVYDEVV